jgi:hypothetical protein
VLVARFLKEDYATVTPTAQLGPAQGEVSKGDGW